MGDAHMEFFLPFLLTSDKALCAIHCLSLIILSVIIHARQSWYQDSVFRDKVSEVPRQTKTINLSTRVENQKPLAHMEFFLPFLLPPLNNK